MCNLENDPASNNHGQEDRTLGCGCDTGIDLILIETFEDAADPKPQRLRAGSLCPYCKTHQLDYDGQINLACPKCGVISGGCFT